MIIIESKVTPHDTFDLVKMGGVFKAQFDGHIYIRCGTIGRPTFDINAVRLSDGIMHVFNSSAPVTILDATLTVRVK